MWENFLDFVNDNFSVITRAVIGLSEYNLHDIGVLIGIEQFFKCRIEPVVFFVEFNTMVFGDLISRVAEVSGKNGKPEQRVEDWVFVIEYYGLDFLQH